MEGVLFLSAIQEQAEVREARAVIVVSAAAIWDSSLEVT